MTLDCEVASTEIQNDKIFLKLSNGTDRLVDHVIVATGYKVDIARYGFFSPAIRSSLKTVGGNPVLARGLESSVPGLHFVGKPAAWSFGPLLYILRNDLELTGPQFGCGLAQCGACSVLIDGKEVRSCVTPISTVANGEITTLEGLPARWAKQKGLSAEEAKNTLHPVQQAWIEEQTPLCGFCQSGMMIVATELLEQNPNPTVTQIKEAFTTTGPSH